MTDAEDRAGVQPLDELIAERDVLTERIAPLWAKYGPGGTAEAVRKAEVARIAGLLRALAGGKGEKITEAAIDQAAHCHEDYTGLLALMTTERAEFFRLQSQLDILDWKCNRGQALLRLAAREVAL